MTLRVKRNKWILYRHTSNFELVKVMAMEVKNRCKTCFSVGEQKRIQERLAALNLYKERNPNKPLDAINHRINTLAYYMFGYKDKVDNEKRFMFSPLGNLFLKHINDEQKLSFIFLTMLYGMQYQHPHGSTHIDFQLYPFRLIFKLLRDVRLEYKLYNFEVEYFVMFVKKMDDKTYEEIVKSILSMRKLSNEEIESKFMEDEHAYVNAAYEWEYYTKRLLTMARIWDSFDGDTICKLAHPTNTRKSSQTTKRRVTRGFVKLKDELIQFVDKLLANYAFDQQPLMLNDTQRLKIDVIKEIYNFYPKILLEQIGETVDEFQTKLLELPKLIERYSNNTDGLEAYLFEDVLVKGFNMFYNVEANGIGGAGQTDIECLYLTKKKKFAVDAKSTANKLSSINSGRLRAHRELIGAEYTIVVTPRYVPAVLQDIYKTPIVIIRASTFSEYLYNHINNEIHEIDYEDFDSIIINNLGKDVSHLISDKTIEKFAAFS